MMSRMIQRCCTLLLPPRSSLPPQACTLMHPTSFDEGEDIETVLVPISTMDQMVRDGIVQHALVVTAFYHYRLR